MFGLKSCRGKVVVITGASSGIGESLARAFGEQGARVALLARRKDRIEQIGREILARKGEAIWVACDVTKPESLDAAFAEVRDKFGWADIVVANAGFGVVGTFESLTLDDYRRQAETNVFGVISTLKAALPDLKRMQGRFVIIGSIKGHVALAGGSAYSMSKFAVRALALSWKFELAPYGISVTHIAPGYVETEFRNVDNEGRWHLQAASEGVPAVFRMRPEKAAAQILRATMKRKDEEVITRHGQFIVWFFRHFPSVFNRLVSRAGVKTRSQPR